MADHATQALRDVQHFGEEGGVVPVIDVAATSTFLNPSDMERVFQGELAGCYLYSRHSNPTVNMFGQKMAALEGMEAGLGVASGMAAISCAIEQLMPDGGHLVCARTVYGGTYALLAHVFPRRGLRTTFVDASAVEQVEKAIQKDTKIIYVETLSNPLLAATDLSALGKLCRARGLKLVVDNTFTPVMVRPGDFGADVVVHSCTKYISGASDLIAGAIVGSSEFIAQLIDVNHGSVMLRGPVLDPHLAHELYSRLDHLPIRMAAHSRVALDFSQRCESLGIRTIYPGLESYPQRDLVTKLMHPEYGFGGMVTLDCGSAARALDLASRLQQAKFGLYAVSLGFSRTLMTCPALSTSSEIPLEDQARMGLSPGLLRLSLGYTGHGPTQFERFAQCYRDLP